MRVLLLLNGRFPTEKAYGIQTLTMARGYVAAGHDVAIAYPRRSNDEPQPIAGVTFLPFGPRRTLHAGWPFQSLRILGMLEAASVIRSFRPDIVIANDPLQAAWFARRFPVLWEIHDLPGQDRFGRRLLVSSILKHAKGIVSTNALKIDTLKRLGHALPPHVVVPNAVTFEPETYRRIDRTIARHELGLSPDECSVVYAGQLFNWKGADTLIEAAAHLPAGKSVIHVVGGTGKDFERCTRLVESLPSGSARVVLHGQRPSEEIPTWLRAATLVVIPNSGKFDVSSRDTSPLKLFESLAAGAAIVASDLPSIREVVGDSSAVRFFAPDDHESLALAIRSLMDDAEAITALRRNAERFPLLSGRDRAEKLAEFVRSVLD